MRECAEEELARVIKGLTYAMNDILAEQKIQFQWMVTHHFFATKQDIESLKHTIMSAISDFAAKFADFQDRQDKAIADLQGDVQNLNDQITKLQGTQGQITPEDQALLDQIQSRASAISDKLDALDEITPPAITDGSGQTPPDAADRTSRRNA